MTQIKVMITNIYYKHKSIINKQQTKLVSSNIIKTFIYIISIFFINQLQNLQKSYSFIQNWSLPPSMLQDQITINQQITINPIQKSSPKINHHSLSKHKLILSPSKDLLIFFDNTHFNKFNPIKLNKDKKPNNKLTLNKKNIDSGKKPQQKMIQHNFVKNHKILSTTNSTQSFVSNNQLLNDRKQKFAQLKKQVDQIRRKYSYSKLVPKNSLKKVNSAEFLRAPSQISTSNNNNYSLNSSKQKISCLTPKHDRYLGKRILTKNLFSDKPLRNLRLTTQSNKLMKTLKPNTQQSILLRRKQSYEFQNLTSSVNLNSQICQADNNKPFQFTFGTMALMDFQNKQNLRFKANKISL